MLVSGCLPEGCFNRIEDVKKAKAIVKQVDLTDTYNIDPETKLPRYSTPLTPPPPSRTPVCKEFATMRIEAQEILIFVDANQANHDNSGESWERASKSLVAAFKTAINNRLDELRNRWRQKKINIIVAGGLYSFAHELGVLGGALGPNSSLINLEGYDPRAYQNIHILGGYRSGDQCFDRSKNEGADGRETILDGDNQSNNVINIAGDAQNIAIKDITIANGRAVKNDPLQPYRKMGGAILIRTASKDIVLENIKVNNAHADDKGGCVAIIGDAKDITLNNVELDHCTAENGGGGLYIGENSHTITADHLSVTNSNTNHVDSTGGGVMISENAGVAGGAENIKFLSIKVLNNRSSKGGGGVYIGGTEVLIPARHFINDHPGQITFEGPEFQNNVVDGPDSFGGGIAIVGPHVGRIKLQNAGSIKQNTAKLRGGGVYIGETGIRPPAPDFDFTFFGLNIDDNRLDGAIGDKKGAGVMVQGPSGLIAFSNSSISMNKANSEGVGVAIWGQVAAVGFRIVSIMNNAVLDGVSRDGNGIWINRGLGIGERPTDILFIDGKIGNHVNGQDGAGLFVRGASVRLSGLEFENNHSVGRGGAAFIENSHVNRHRDITYHNNSSQGSGGGLWVDGTYDAALANNDQPLEMLNITCTDNSSVNQGGCIFIAHAPNTVINGGTFTKNGLPKAARTALNPWGPAVAINTTREGGALYYASNSGAGGNDVNAKLQLENNAFFEDNHAFSAGGALYTLDVYHLVLESVTFKKNKATEDAGPLRGKGGAIFANFDNFGGARNVNHRSGATVQVKKGTKFETNSAIGDGGAMYLGLNVKEFNTGGVAVAGGAAPGDVIDVKRVEFTGNTSAHGSGGAIYAGFFQAPLSKLLLGNASFSTNTSDVNGGAVSIYNPPRDVRLVEWIDKGANPAVHEWEERSAKFTDNTAGQNGGGISLATLPAAQAFINHLITSKATEFLRNNANAGNGGGLWVDNTIDFANANDLSGIYHDNKAPLSLGGAVALMGNLPNPHLTMFSTNDAEFKNNEAGLKDPAIHLAHIPGAGFRFRNTKFLNHRRVSNGCGGVMDWSGINIDRLFFEGGQISTNKALGMLNGNGGAFCVNRINQTLDINSLLADGNEANGSGGFLYVANGSAVLDVVIDGTVFYDNKALAGNGGVVSIPEINGLRVINTRAILNRSSNNGGVANIATVHGDVNITSPNGSLLKFFLSLLRRVAGYPGIVANEDLVGQANQNRAGGSGGIFDFGQVDGNLIVSNQIWIKNYALGGAGGALHVGSMPVGGGRVASFTSTLMGKNEANGNGGALSIDNLNGSNFSMEQNDIAPVSRREYVKDRHLRKDINDFYSFVDVLAFGNLAPLHNIDPHHEKQGLFLVEGNTSANGNGGAIYVDNVNDVTVENMSFANNKATNGSGGTIFVDNLHNQVLIESSTIYGGEAGNNAGGVFVQGDNIANSPRRLFLQNSSIQQSRVAGGPGINGAAGIFLTQMNLLQIEHSNFFANRVLQAPAGTVWAAAVKFLNITADQLPVMNPFYGGEADDINAPLVPRNAIAPVIMGGPIDLQDNVVQGPGQAGSIGTISIPAALHNINAATGVCHYYQYSHGAFDTQANNDPPPIDNHPRNVVVAH